LLFSLEADMLKLELDTVKAYSVDDEFKFRMEAD
jgi:hypothetical protein